MSRCRGDRGQAAGIETVPFGILVFVGGLLLAVNAWAVVDTRAAVDTAARDYLRAYTSAPTAADGSDRGRAAVTESLAGRHVHAEIVDPVERFGACHPATVTVRIDVGAIRAPFIGSIGTTTVTATQTELVQAYGAARHDDTSPCDG